MTPVFAARRRAEEFARAASRALDAGADATPTLRRAARARRRAARGRPRRRPRPEFVARPARAADGRGRDRRRSRPRPSDRPADACPPRRPAPRAPARRRRRRPRPGRRAPRRWPWPPRAPCPATRSTRSSAAIENVRRPASASATPARAATCSPTPPAASTRSAQLSRGERRPDAAAGRRHPRRLHRRRPPTASDLLLADYADDRRPGLDRAAARLHRDQPGRRSTALEPPVARRRPATSCVHAAGAARRSTPQAAAACPTCGAGHRRDPADAARAGRRLGRAPTGLHRAGVPGAGTSAGVADDRARHARGRRRRRPARPSDRRRRAAIPTRRRRPAADRRRRAAARRRRRTPPAAAPSTARTGGCPAAAWHGGQDASPTARPVDARPPVHRRRSATRRRTGAVTASPARRLADLAERRVDRPQLRPARRAQRKTDWRCISSV